MKRNIKHSPPDCRIAGDAGARVQPHAQSNFLSPIGIRSYYIYMYPFPARVAKRRVGRLPFYPLTSNRYGCRNKVLPLPTFASVFGNSHRSRGSVRYSILPPPFFGLLPLDRPPSPSHHHRRASLPACTGPLYRGRLFPRWPSSPPTPVTPPAFLSRVTFGCEISSRRCLEFFPSASTVSLDRPRQSHKD